MVLFTGKQKTIVLALIFTLALFRVTSGLSEPQTPVVYGPVTVPDFNIPYHAVATDQHGFIYLAGPASVDLKATAESFDTTYNGGETDIFLAKFAPQSPTPLTVTLIGGSGYEWCRDIMVDKAGNIVLTGTTNSSDFALEGSPGNLGIINEYVVFIAQLDENLTLLKNVKLLGPGEGFSLAQSADKNIYIAGRADSPAFPTSGKSWDNTYNGGGGDAFVAQVNEDLNLEHVTFLGGIGRELALSITTAKSGNVLVAGFTDSNDFPVVGNKGIVAPVNRNGNGFIAKFNSDLNSLLAAVQLGGSDHDVIHSLALGKDKDESIYVTGLTLSSDFPVTPGTYDTNYNGHADIFVSRINANLEQLMVSTFLGGLGRDWGFSMALNPDQSVVIAGDTESADFPDLAGIDEESRMEGVGDIVIAQFNPDLTTLEKTIRAGGNLNERVPVIALDRNSNIVTAGLSNSPDFLQTTKEEAIQKDSRYRFFLTYTEQNAPYGK